MNSKFVFFSLMLFAFLTINMTCNQTTPLAKPDVTTTQTTDSCIDKSKINASRGCPRNLDPVCGCDGKTYNNDCLAENAGVTKWTKGKCPCIDRSKIDKNAACAKIYKPVCGCDNKTYGNECEAEKAGVTSWTQGKCRTSSSCIDPAKVNPNGACASIYQPVCGCDNKTYGNACEADKAGVTKWTEGKCKTKNSCIDPAKITNKDCPENYEPVCGCDGKTYGNKCEAESKGLIKWTPGKCPDNKDTGCIDLNKAHKGGCPENYEPVCGCNGKTYGNICEARSKGVTKWVEGPCGK